MNDHFGWICDVLDKQLACYRRLLELTLQETDALRRRDAASLGRIHLGVEEQLCLIAELETQHGDSVRTLAQELDCSPEALTVTGMLESCAGPHRVRLERIKAQILEVGVLLSRAVARSAALADHVRACTRDMLGIYFGLCNRGTVYRRQGGVNEPRSRLDRTVG